MGPHRPPRPKLVPPLLQLLLSAALLSTMARFADGNTDPLVSERRKKERKLISFLFFFRALLSRRKKEKRKKPREAFTSVYMKTKTFFPKKNSRLRAAAPLSSRGGGGSSPSLSARVPPAPEPFNSARDRFAARFQSGPLARLSTPPQLSHWDFERAVGDPLRAIAENNRERFSEGGGGGGGGASRGGSAGPGRGRAGGALSCLSLLRLAKDACLLARRALPQLAGAETAALGPRALSEEEEGALSRVLGMTAVSLGVLEKEELEAEEELLLLRAKRGRNDEGAAAPDPPSAPAPSPLLVSWDCSIHALYPALRVKRK